MGLLLLLLLLAGCSSKDITQTMKGLKGGSLGGQWCQPGDQIGMKYYMPSIVGLEDYSSDRLEGAGKLCHLIAKDSTVTADFYLDETALEHFRGNEKAVGNGCVVFSVPGTESKTEMCFGEKAKA